MRMHTQPMLRCIAGAAEDHTAAGLHLPPRAHPTHPDNITNLHHAKPGVQGCQYFIPSPTGVQNIVHSTLKNAHAGSVMHAVGHLCHGCLATTHHCASSTPIPVQHGLHHPAVLTWPHYVNTNRQGCGTQALLRNNKHPPRPCDAPGAPCRTIPWGSCRTALPVPAATCPQSTSSTHNLVSLSTALIMKTKTLKATHTSQQ